MKKKLVWGAAALLLVLLAAGNVYQYLRLGKAERKLASAEAKLANTEAELTRWEIHVEGVMNYLHAMSYDEEAIKTPERRLPKDPPKRLAALADRVEKRLGRCVVALARSEAELNGHRGPHVPDGY